MKDFWMVMLVFILCLTLYGITDRLCRFGEATTWEEAEIEQAKRNGWSGYCQGKADAFEEMRKK